MVDTCGRHVLVTAQAFLLALHICACAGDRVYSFPVFSVHFCELFLAELDNYEKSDIIKHRPNTMNKFGVSQCHDSHRALSSMACTCTVADAPF